MWDGFSTRPTPEAAANGAMDGLRTRPTYNPLVSALLLYVVVVCAILWAWDRWVQPVTLAAALVLLLLPFCFVGRALLTGRIYAPIDLPYMSEPLKAFRPDFGIDTIHNGTQTDLYQQIIPWRAAVRWAWTH